jgi:SAM-dependent methyltransferase
VALDVRVMGVQRKLGEIGGSCTAWLEVAAEGSGMQARYGGMPTDFFSDDPFRREDETVDSRFYSPPRLVSHIDEQAISVISGIYGKHLANGMEVLDLMSSWQSHIPKDILLHNLVGIGLNEEELRKNSQLTDYLIHDLNTDPRLPFGTDTFDAVICTVSIEYFIHPFNVFEEIARVLRPQGVCIMTLSNRWFPPKAIRIWSEIHEFERMGLVIEYFLRSGKFNDIGTYSMRGLPRPEDDPYFPQLMTADPVYAVWGKKVVD